MNRMVCYHPYRQRKFNGEIVTKRVNASAALKFATFSNTCPFHTYEYGVAAENAVGRGPKQ